MRASACAFVLMLCLPGCETIGQSTALDAKPAASACTPGPVTGAGGREYLRTCGMYRECALFQPMTPAGEPSGGVPFFLSTGGQPLRDYPGEGQCL